MRPLVRSDPWRALRGCAAPALSRATAQALAERAGQVRRDLLRMTTAAGSGHVGGALSSADLLVVVQACLRADPGHSEDPDRDRLVLSHGHVSAALYAVLGHAGYLDLDAAIAGFRRAGSPFEGHPNAQLPGVEWSSGALGQGLSVGCGLALAARLSGRGYRVFVAMGDGEQQKGQIGEALAFAGQWRLGNLTALIDRNRLQATGAVDAILRQDLAARYATAGWDVQTVPGHDHTAIYAALRASRQAERPTLILADTVMGKGVEGIEDNAAYHGAVLDAAQLQRALTAFPAAIPGDGSVRWRQSAPPPCPPAEASIVAGPHLRQPAGTKVDLRAAWGRALLDLMDRNQAPMAVLDCDLAPSLKTDAIRKQHPQRFIQCGIAEHHAASLAGGLSRAGVVTFLAGFAVFMVDEIHGQLRMIDVNRTSLKIIASHCGLDVGADGKTHQCLDPLALSRNLASFTVLAPADANQMDAMVRHAATTAGNVLILCGRSALPVLTRADGRLQFDAAYRYRPGRADWLRRGNQATIVTWGTMAHRAVQACDVLAGQGISVGVLSFGCLSQLDLVRLRQAAATGHLLIYEDHHRDTGLGIQVAALCAEAGWPCTVRRLGRLEHGGSGSPEDLYRQAGLSVDDCVAAMRADLRRRSRRQSR